MLENRGSAQGQEDGHQPQFNESVDSLRLAVVMAKYQHQEDHGNEHREHEEKPKGDFQGFHWMVFQF
jgi:hypothetical protein